MSKITWLHLSDFHFQATRQRMWDEDIVLKSLLTDVQRCVEERELALDLILVSGDIAFSGAATEYNLARSFFDELLVVTKLHKDRLFVVPGNHDVNRGAISPIARYFASSVGNRQAVNEALIDDLDRRLILRKFDDYASFVKDYFSDYIPFDDGQYFYVRSLNLAEQRIAILSLNSAWLAHGGNEDRGRLALGERQVRQALDASRGAGLSIGLLHHPFDWLLEFDRESCEALLMDGCNFILHGHLHRVGLLGQVTPDARVMTIAAGACYEDYQYPNSYNLVQLNLETGQGTVFLRAWSNQKGGFWTEDVQTYRNVKDGEFTFLLDDLLYGLRIPQTWGDLGAGGWTGDSVQTIETQFLRHTERALDQIHPLIPGIDGSLPREEITWLEARLQGGEPVVLTGDVGTGKSGIGAKLARSARERGVVVLFLDARRVGRVQNEAELRQHFDLHGPIHSAIERIGRYKECRFIIDQLDNIAGSPSATLLIDLAIECCQFKGVEIVVISRKQETQEAKLVQKLINAGFAECNSASLSEKKVEEILKQIGIRGPAADLVSLGRNLLNLELIGTIRQEQLGTDFSALMNEVDLWERYIQVLLEREELASRPDDAEQIVAEAVQLARAGLNTEGGTFAIGYPASPAHMRLISWGIVVHEGGRVYRFRHEQFQDFLYAWDATERKLMPTTVLSEISPYRTQNVLIWMDKIYSRRDPELRRQFLKEVLNVQ